MKTNLLILLTALMTGGRAASAQTFYRTYHASPSATVLDLYPTKDSGFTFLTGVNGVNTMHKVDKAGSTQWTKTLSASSRRVIQSTTGNYFTTDFYNGSRQYVVSLNAAGVLRFVKGYYLGSSQILNVYNLCPANDGGYLLCGAGNGSPSIIRCDSNGAVVWAKSYAGTSAGTFANTIWQILPAVSGTGYVCQGATGANKNYYSAMEIDASGNIVWAKDYTMPLAGTYNPLSIVRENNGYAMAYSFDGGAADTVHPVFVTRVDAAGTPVWTKAYSHNRYVETSHALASNKVGEIYIGGMQHVTAASGTTSYYQMLLDSNGAVKWAQTALGGHTTLPYQYGVVTAASTYNDGFLAGCQAGWETAPVALTDRNGGGFCTTTAVAVTATAVPATVSSPGTTSFVPAILIDAAVPSVTLGNMSTTDSVKCATSGPSVGVATAVAARAVSIYPNPARGVVNVRLQDEQWTGIELSDVHGRLLAAVRNADRSEGAHFDVRSLAPGLYILSVRFADGTAVREKVRVGE